MNTKSSLLLPLAISLASLQGCSTMDQKTSDTQPSAQAEARTPVAVPPKAEVPVTPVAATPAAVTTPQVETSKLPVLVDRYTVVSGDTLALIAAKKEVYGDTRLWPLLYRANVNQLGPRGLIFPNQVLVVDRNHTQEDIKALIGRTKQPAAPVPLAAKAPIPQTVPPATTTAPSTPLVPAAPPAAASKPVVEKPAVATTAPTSHAVAPAGTAPKGAPAGGQTPKLSDYLNGAREAFAAGDAPWAIYYYAVYLEQKNTDANVWGELGNVYYLDGNFVEAAKAYYNVANLLIDRGQTARALELIPVIEEGDPSLSAAIYQRLTTVKQ